MKLTIDDVEYPFPKVGTWSYDEADAALRVSGISPGRVQQGLLEGDHRAHLAVAVVAFVRAHPDRDPMELRVGKNVDHNIVHLFEKGIGEEEADAGPPAEAGDAGATATASETTLEPVTPSDSPPTS